MRPGAEREHIDLAQTPYQLAEDEFTRFVSRECGAAVRRWLEQRGNLQQPIDKLTNMELAGMAWEVIAKYAELRERKRKELQLLLKDDAERQRRLDSLLGV